QGLWFLFGFPFFVGEYLFRDDLPLPVRLDCIQAMVYPFRDYYAEVSTGFAGTFFYMWWDNVLHGGRSSKPTEEAQIESEIITVLEQILALPNEGCGVAALHGLNHLHPNPRAKEIISNYLESNRPKMTAEQIEWISACRDGLAL